MQSPAASDDSSPASWQAAYPALKRSPAPSVLPLTRRPGRTPPALAAAEPRLARVVGMRYVAGMGDAEVASAMGLTDRTVRRDWDKARRLLRARLA